MYYGTWLFDSLLSKICQIEQRSIWLRESIVFAAVISAFEDIYYFVAECHPFLDYKAR